MTYYLLIKNWKTEKDLSNSITCQLRLLKGVSPALVTSDCLGRIAGHLQFLMVIQN